MIDYKPFSLSDNFIDGYKRKKAPFGFNGLGELVYMRTYSRIKDDGKNEMWWETVQRVVEGTYNMQKKHIERYDLGWNAWQAQRSAQEMYDRIFNMKFLPPGRGLWSMGTSLTEEKGLYAALNNCAFVSTVNLKDDLSKPFTFLMDASMVGVGVGFDTKGANSFIVRGPKEDRINEVYVIPDSREGWVESLRRLLDSYFLGIAPVEFDYSEIRGSGEPIKGFGGVSSGPEPLKEVHRTVMETLDKNIGEPISITTIVDIMNLIGKCVVAGNVRRTAEIVFGDSESDEYINLKNYKKNPHREEYGWTSNNSIFADLGMDYTKAAERINDNGEPGFAWLENMQDYSRMRNGKDRKDHRVSGGNPCVVGDTLITVADGRNAVPIKDLVDTQYPVYSIDGHGKVVIKQSIKTWKTKENAEIWKLTLDDGSHLLATPDHKIMLRNGEYKELKDLQEGESVFPFNSFNKNGYRNIRGTGKRRSGIRQYRMITEHELGYMPDAKEYAIHHIDFDKTNDSWDNLDVITQSEHSSLHRLIDNPMHNPEYVEKMKNTREEKGYNLPEKNPMYGKHHKKSTLKSIGKKSKENWENQRDFMIESIKNGMTEEVGKRISKRMKEKTIWVDWNCPVCNKQKKLTEYQSSKRKTCSYSCSNVKRGMENQGIWNHKAVSVEFYGHEDVYDMTVEDTHNFGVITSTKDDKYLDSSGLFIHNCLEQSLESYELCCLVETFPTNHKDLDDYLKTLKYAYLYAKTVTLGKTHWSETNRVMLRNRRIGCSVSGIAQFITSRGLGELKDWLEGGYDKIQEYDKLYSDWLAVPRSIKTTSVKPSGCTIPSTVIKTNDGNKSLFEIFNENGIDLGEKIDEYREWYDVNKDIFVYDSNGDEKKITKLFVNGNEQTIKFTMEDNSIIECTPNHKFMMSDGSWKEAKDIIENDDFITGYIMKFIKKEISEAFTVDVEVEDTHNYQLENGIVSHNSISLLAGATPGIHYPESRFYIRRIRLGNDSPLIKALKSAGYHIEPANGQEDSTVVVEVPVDVGEGIRTL